MHKGGNDHKLKSKLFDTALFKKNVLTYTYYQRRKPEQRSRGQKDNKTMCIFLKLLNKNILIKQLDLL